MEVGELTKEGKVIKSRIVEQSKLSSECWMIQFNGLDACETCQYKKKPRLCGGKKIRETGKNEHGHTVPI